MLYAILAAQPVDCIACIVALMDCNILYVICTFGGDIGENRHVMPTISLDFNWISKIYMLYVACTFSGRARRSRNDTNVGLRLYSGIGTRAQSQICSSSYEHSRFVYAVAGCFGRQRRHRNACDCLRFCGLCNATNGAVGNGANCALERMMRLVPLRFRCGSFRPQPVVA